MKKYAAREQYRKRRAEILAWQRQRAKKAEVRAKRKAYEQVNRDRIRNYNRQWVAANREYVARQQKERVKRADPDGERAAHYRTKYNRQKKEQELALLTVALASRTSTDSAEPPPV